ncbi:hypothetical protein Zmor_018044 [Zophobas morio]|uniref:Uncharacterized protein n=1 Tax=Zophobas morio TaxID=2755281 RepID=A0AA38MDG8_9CUCU|nr:hypothetical protein Zmor_018044 [Zophobas morio]
MVNINTILKFLMLQTVTSLQEFIEQNLHRKTLVVISSDFHNIDENVTFIFRLILPKLIINSKNITNLEIFNDYIIVEPDAITLSSSLDLIKYNINSRGRFLIIVEKPLSVDQLKSTFQELWRLYIYNVIIYTNGSYVTWYPYLSKNRCGTATNIVSVLSSNPYDNKIPKKFNGCPITVTWDKLALAIKTPFDKSDPGYSIRLLDTVAQMINISTIYLTKNLPYMKAGKKDFRPLKQDIRQRNIDLVFMVAMAPISPEFEHSIPYYETYCYFVLPPRRKIISSTTTLFIFSTEIWMLIFASAFTMGVLLNYLDDCSLVVSLFQIIELMLQGTVRKVAKNTFVRLVFTVFFFYVLHLAWIYSSQLSGVMTKPSYEPKISTIKELGMSEKKLQFSDVWLGVFANKSAYTNILKKQVKPEKVPSFEKEVLDFTQKLDHAIVISMDRLLFIKNYNKLHLVQKDKV